MRDNAGAASLDRQTLEQFTQNLKDTRYTRRKIKAGRLLTFIASKNLRRFAP